LIAESVDAMIGLSSQNELDRILRYEGAAGTIAPSEAQRRRSLPLRGGCHWIHREFD